MRQCSRRIAVTCLLAALCLATQPAAQEPAAPQGPLPTFRAGVDSISVDAIVTDKQGRPVLDLTPADFEIREGGRPQTIESFRLVQIDDGFDDPSAQRNILSSSDHAVEVAKETNRLLVIFLDDYHTRSENSFGIREQLAAFVSQLAPRDLVALAMPLTPPSALTFSRNHEATAGQIMSFMGRKYDYRPKHPIEAQYTGEPPAVLERMRNSWTIAGMRSLCEYLGTFRIGRKTVLYVSEGMSNTLPAGVQTRGSDFSTMPTTGAQAAQGGRALSQQLLESMELVSDLQRVFSAAARTNTSIYTIDPRGLTSMEFSLADNVSLAMDKTLLTQTTELLRTIADQTDGRAIVSRNDPLPALRQMVRDSSTYYLLGYNSSFSYRDGKFHEIDVRVKRRDVEVRARKGYWAVSADELARAVAPKTTVRADVTEALDALATSHESGRRQPVTVWMGATRGAAEKASVTLVWEANTSPTLESYERVDHLVVSAHSIQGEPLFSGRIDREPGADRPAGHATFDAPAGSVRVRIETQNAAGRRLEVTDSAIEVPDFTSTAVQLTTPFVYRGRTARDLQALRALPAARPTASRTFARAERLLVRFTALAPGGNVPTVTMRVLNQNGTSVASMPAPTRTAGNTFESEFSLGAFPPSDYLIEIAADMNGDVVTQLLAIRVAG